METTNFNAKKALQLTRMIYSSLVLGITFFLVVVLMMSEKLIFKIDASDPIILVLIVFTVIALPAGYIISKKLFSSIDPNSTLGTRYPKYQVGLLIKLATCEASALFSIVSILLTENLFALVFLFLSITVILTYFPTPAKIGIDINLTDSEIEQFNN